MTNKFLKSIIVVGSLVFLASCSDKEDTMLEDQPAETLYSSGMDLLLKQKYHDAAKAFDEVDRQHPYSKWAAKAQLMTGFAYYQEQKYDLAIASFETFVQLHPGHPDAAYAHYMLGMCYYEQILKVDRDQDTTLYAQNAFQDLLKKFPDSTYARDAKYKLELVRDHLAGKEMTNGRLYLSRNAYLAAIIRFKYVVEHFQTTSHVPEALHRLVECYTALGLNDEAQAAAAVLGHNYPGSPWYADTYYLLEGKDLRPDESKTERSWLNRFLGKRLKG